MGTRLITALDFAARDAALALAERLDPELTRVKVGNELFTAAGPALVETLQGRGFEVFLDLKYHDIPNTVAAACARAADLGVWMVNVHAAGGRRMLEAAREAVPRVGGSGAEDGERSDGPAAGAGSAAGGTRLIAVTGLTSLAREDLAETGLDVDPDAQVRRLAALAHTAGLDGVVCSPREVALVQAEAPPPFLAVTPGIRPAPDGTASVTSRGGADDQRRTLTPGEAILAGADHLVVGRAVTQAPEPIAALEAIAAEVDAALAERGEGDATG